MVSFIGEGNRRILRKSPTCRKSLTLSHNVVSSTTYRYFNAFYILIIHLLHENVFTHECHIPRGQCPREIWYSWVNKFSYILYPHAINVLLYRMKPRKHIQCSLGLYPFSYQRTITLAGKPARLPKRWNMIFISRNMIFLLSCVITCCDFFPLSNQINLFMVINIWGIIKYVIVWMVRVIGGLCYRSHLCHL